MTNIIFSGINKAFFNSLIFNNKVNASWLSIDELMSSGLDVDNSDAKFVVLYTSPEVFLSALGYEAISSLAQAEQQWLPQTEMLTQLYLTHKNNAILVNSEQCGDNFDEFTSLLDTKFNIDSQLASTSNIDERQNNEGAQLLTKSLQLMLVTALVDNYDIQSTYENVMGAADLLVSSTDYSPEERACIHRDECEELITKIKLHHADHTGLVKENELTLSKNQALEADLAIAYKEHKTSQEQLTSNKEASNKVAKELASLRKRNVQLEENQSKLNNDITTLSAENELSVFQVLQLQEELESSHKQQITSEEQIADLKAENEIAILQIQQLQEELEFYFIKYQSLNAGSIINDIMPAIIVDQRFEKSLTLARILNA
jgi:hypothetical protein